MLNILLDIIVNGLLGIFLVISFLHLDLLKIYQILLISVLIMNSYLINKKVLRRKDCKVNYKPVIIGLGIGLVNFIFLNIIRKIFSK